MVTKRMITRFVLHINTVRYTKSKLLYINITDRKTIYISWQTGRTYFKVHNSDYKKYIKNITFDDKKYTIVFIYKGPMETNLYHSGKTKKVVKKYTFKFELEKDYKYFKKLLR
jgi:photosystem II stability/assembly factor-like uncharacterized protein